MAFTQIWFSLIFCPNIGPSWFISDIRNGNYAICTLLQVFSHNGPYNAALPDDTADFIPVASKSFLYHKSVCPTSEEPPGADTEAHPWVVHREHPSTISFSKDSRSSLCHPVSGGHRTKIRPSVGSRTREVVVASHHTQWAQGKSPLMLWRSFQLWSWGAVVWNRQRKCSRPLKFGGNSGHSFIRTERET